MRRRLLSLVVCGLIDCVCVFAQINPNPGNTFPTIICPSPELSSLALIGNLTAQNQTGAATVQIPLYDFKVGSLDLPISISYSTNGVKVNDIPSRVGLGWNLIAGGNITRIIHDKDDEYEGTVPMPPPSSFDPADGGVELYEYLHKAVNPVFQTDTEKDEYSFNVNGMSGKFYLDDDGLAHCESQSDIEIKKFGDGFILTSGSGDKYYFGETDFEKTVDIKLNGITRPNTVATTGWFLWRIVSPEKDTVLFTYNEIDIKEYLGQSQMAIFASDTTYLANQFTECHFCDRDQNGGSIFYPITHNWIEYNTQYLSSITCNNGLSAYFFYESRGDLSGDNRLTGINISCSIENTTASTLKRYQFGYDDYPITNDNQKRFYLTKLSSYSATSSEFQAHRFEYEDPGGLPSQKSLSQDYFGYFNGIYGGEYGQYFFPKIVSPMAYINSDIGADRSPVFSAAKKGALTKVIYPTGGYKAFVYEPHSMVQNISSFSSSHISVSCAGIGYDSPHTITRPFSIGSASTNTNCLISCITHQNPLGPLPGQPNYWEAGDGKIITTIRILKASNSNQVWVRTVTIDFLNPAPMVINIPLNTDYILEVTVKGSSYVSDVVLTYNKTESVTPTNVNGCGIRVKQINSFDPVTNKTKSKYYTYGSLLALGAALGKEVTRDDDATAVSNDFVLSSGRGALKASNQSSYLYGKLCRIEHWGSPNPLPYEYPEICWLYQQVSSSSANGFYCFNGSPVAYESIIESDDPNFVNGGTEHYYYTSYEPNNVLPLLNLPISGNLGFGNAMNGKELKTRIFKSTADKFIVLQQEENVYGTSVSSISTWKNYTVRKRFNESEMPWQAPQIVTFQTIDCMYDVGVYGLTSSWSHLDSKISITYDEDGLNRLVQQTNYQYDDQVSKQATEITTTNSKGEIITQRLKYAPEFTNISPYMEMTGAHIIASPIQQENMNNGDLVTSVMNEYASWGSPAIFKPAKTWITKGSNSPEIGLQYDQYDDNGNPLDMTTQAGVNRIYFWNYKHSFPVAEINKATLNSTAYTSFEGDDNGGWHLDRTKIEAGGITGEKAYSGDLDKNVSEATTYIVTLWTKGSVTVNTIPGTLVKTKGLWSLYQWVFNDITLVKVVGTHIDEVRLFPANATITTYTYKPFIGISSVCDNNNNISYFEYDGFNRLLLVRDLDQNILKQYEYTYGATIQPCSNATPNWVLTGNTRCQQDIHDHNNYNGIKQAEKRDVNNCSLTYLQTMWVTITTPPNECTYVPNCTNPDCRVVNGVAEQGVKTLIGSDNSTGTWLCTFIYEWSDGFQSVGFTEDAGVTPCSQVLIVD